VTIVAMPKQVLGLFLVDNATIALGVVPLTVLALSMCIDTFGRVLTFALRGAGATQVIAMVALGLQWCIQLPLNWYVGVRLGYGLVGICVNQLILYSIEATIVSVLWGRGYWSEVRIIAESNHALHSSS
jgi:multidrug resistance protein, MATE family